MTQGLCQRSCVLEPGDGWLRGSFISGERLGLKTLREALAIDTGVSRRENPTPGQVQGLAALTASLFSS